jgi:hypothetical protein
MRTRLFLTFLLLLAIATAYAAQEGSFEKSLPSPEAGTRRSGSAGAGARFFP